MDFITTGVIASAVYDIFKNGLSLGKKALTERLGDWIKTEVIGEALAKEINNLDISDELSEVAISRRLDGSSEISALIREINSQAFIVAASAVTTVSQVHTGSGDNVAGNKIVN